MLDFWSLPGPSQFVARLVAQIRSGRNLVIPFPDHGPEGIDSALRKASLGTWDWVRVDAVASVSPALHVSRAVGRHLQTELNVTARALAGAEDFCGYLVWVDGLSAESWLPWQRFLLDYEHAARQVPEGLRSVFVVVLRGALANTAPAEEVNLAVLPWRGHVGYLDMMLYVALSLASRELLPGKARLLTACAANVAVWDRHVADRLCEERPKVIVNPEPVLREIANARGWKAGEVSAWQYGSEEQVDGVDLIHSVVLAVTPGSRELRRRIWSAQASVLLPLVEERRSDLLPKVRRFLRLPFATDAGEIADPEDLELGHLSYLLRHSPVDPRIRQTVDRLVTIRNALAHLEPIEAHQALHEDLYR